ncbi:MAG TPA: diacylglycerol kinase [bacterium]|nr:diacylglycerol kinase [bacterium]
MEKNPKAPPTAKRISRETILESFDHAFRGLLFCARRERNFQIHLIIAGAVLVGSLFLNLSLLEFYVLILVITMVLVAEMVNTAFEKLADLVAPEQSRRVRDLKNIGAACVLVVAAVSVLIGYLILGTHLAFYSPSALRAVQNSPWYLTVVALLATIVAVLFLKRRLQSRSLFHGGMPSGHAAVSFALVTGIFFTSGGNLLVTALALPLAVLVAQSRVRRDIHTWPEVIYGALLGAGMTTLIFQVLHLPTGK